MRDKAKCEQADGWSCASHKFLKRRKIRLERRRAKRDPECVPGYRFFRGYEL